MAIPVTLKLNGRVGSLAGARVGGRGRTTRAAAGADRPMWLTGVSAPKHLDGSMPGDYGFDPLGLGADPEKLKWYQEAELMNARFAMLGAAGILGGEALGVYNDTTWVNAGAKGYDIPILPLVAIQAVVMGFLETKRYIGFKKTGLSGGLVDTQPFDPAGMLSDEMKLKEVKNGRLAMVAMFGFAGQAYTGVGPLANWKAHLADPFGSNIVTNVLNIQNTLPDPGFAKVATTVAETVAN